MDQKLNKVPWVPQFHTGVGEPTSNPGNSDPQSTLFRNMPIPQSSILPPFLLILEKLSLYLFPLHHITMPWLLLHSLNYPHSHLLSSNLGNPFPSSIPALEFPLPVWNVYSHS